LVEIIYNRDNRENTIKIKLDDKHVEEFLKSIEVLKQNSYDSGYWTYCSLSSKTGAGHITTVDIYPQAPFFAEGEDLVWYNTGIVKKKIAWLQALTNYRVYYYDYVQHAGVFVLMPGLQDAVVMNQRRASNSTSIGTYAMSRYNITGFRNNRTTSFTIGDVQFIAEGKPYIIFPQVGDPNGLARLVKSLKQQQAQVQIGGLQVQMQSELGQSEVKEAQTAPESDKASITCSQCNNSNPHGAQFCNTCGSKLQPGCSKCGIINPEQSKFCNKCGFTLA